jgi:hypothetical protein
MSSSEATALDKGTPVSQDHGPGSQDHGSKTGSQDRGPEPGSQDRGPKPKSQDRGIRDSSQDHGIREPAQDQGIADPSAVALRLAAEVERALAEGRADALTEEALQALVAAACRVYSVRVEKGEKLLPLPERSQVMDTDVMVMASGLLRAVNLQVFELGMWQSWTGR